MKRAQEVLAQQPRRSSPERIAEIQQLLLTGGFPSPALMDSESARRTWFESYRQTYMERDLRDLANIHNLPEFSRLLTILALRTAQLLNLSEFSRDIALPVTTLRRYFQLLDQTYQLFLLPPYSANLAKRLIKTPKVYAADTGLACYLSAADSWDTLVRQNRVGAMVETWVANELRKLLSVPSRRTHLLYWRTRTGQEVDFLLERGGEVVGIEVKWGMGFSNKDLSGLMGCRALLGKRWRCSVLLHGGTEAVTLDEQTLAVPFSVLFGREE
jgi:predicted AAA+ superfamily ATPase